MAGKTATAEKPTAETVLVTGAGGFIGGRVVEALILGGTARVRPALRRWSSAARIARFEVEPVLCDVTETEQIEGALAGVDAVVHCAMGEPEVTVEGTRKLLAACLEHGVRRVVYLSTVEVYGDAAGNVDESTPLVPSDSYGESKVAAEEICREFHDLGLEVSILRPAIVYGPFSRWWTERFAQRLGSGQWRLFEGFGEGRCNLIYIDDLVAAILACLSQPRAAGEAFNVNGPDDVSWNEYVEALNRELGLPPLIRSQRRSTWLKTAALWPVRAAAEFAVRHFEKLIFHIYERFAFTRGLIRRTEQSLRTTPAAQELNLYQRGASYPTDKATDLLGWRPRVDMRQGLELSRRWLVHHGFEPDP